MESRKPILLVNNSFEPVQGIEETIPVIFLHGLTSSKENWGDIPQIVANATGRKAYALDARNHGDSEWCDTFDFQINADDVLFFMDTMNIAKAILVGHSMGGMTVMKAALRAPDRVEKLVVEDMTVTSPPKTLLNNSIAYLTLAREALEIIPSVASMDEAKSLIRDYAYQRASPNLKAEMNLQSNDQRLILKQTTDGRFAFKANLDLLLEIMKDANTMLTPYEGLYKGPACFIYGGKSPFLVGQDEHLVKKFFPKAEMIGIEDAFHCVHYYFALRFTEALLTFLQGGWNKRK